MARKGRPNGARKLPRGGKAIADAQPADSKAELVRSATPPSRTGYDPAYAEPEGTNAKPCQLCGAPMRGWQPIQGGPTEWGHNARPLGPPGTRCCDTCNTDKVIPARMVASEQGSPDPRSSDPGSWPLGAWPTTAGQVMAARNSGYQADAPGAPSPGAEQVRPVRADPPLRRINWPAADPGPVRHAADVADFRAWLVRQWQPGGPFFRAAHAMADTPRGRQLHKGGMEALATDAECEVRCLHRAQLYYVEPNMVDLLATVAPGCPDDVRPTDLVHPADDGLVVLAKPLMGTASDTAAPVEVWAFTWSHTSLRSNVAGASYEQQLEARYGRSVPCLSVASYRLVDFDKGLNPEELAMSAVLLGADVTGPWANAQGVQQLHGHMWTPMGRSDWPMRDHLADVVPWALDATMADSITEDRRMVTALFTCLAQQGLAAQVVDHGPRQQVRRLARSGLTTAEPAKVTVVNLRQPRKLPHAEPAPAGATLRTHRWLVREHPRWQACGPGRADRRLVIVPAHIKGPEGAPLVIKTRVNRWVR